MSYFGSGKGSVCSMDHMGTEYNVVGSPIASSSQRLSYSLY